MARADPRLLDCRMRCIDCLIVAFHPEMQAKHPIDPDEPVAPGTTSDLSSNSLNRVNRALDDWRNRPNGRAFIDLNQSAG
jgi:hypothetical protein